jgi:hypothetical protein
MKAALDILFTGVLQGFGWMAGAALVVWLVTR